MQDDVLYWQTWGQVVHRQTCGEEFLEPVTVRDDSDLKFCTSCALLPVRTVRGRWGILGWLSTAEMLRRF